MRWKLLMPPRRDAPLPLWMIFPVVFTALYASHATLMRLPYYWDEAGYYIPAAWDFFRTGSLIPTTTLTNAHPPLPSIYLALWWKLSGYLPEVTRVSVLLVAALGLLAVGRLAMRLTNPSNSLASPTSSGSVAIAFWTVVLTGLYPVWFAQSTMAHADIFAAACTLWGLVYALPDRNRKPWAAALWFAAAVLSKETAIAIPLVLAGIALGAGLRMPKSGARRRLFKEAAWLAGCVLPLIGWYAWHYAKTGFLFGNPEYLRYNAQANLDPIRIMAAFGHRLLHLTAHMNLFVPVGMALAALLLNPHTDADGNERPGLSPAVTRRILLLLLVNALFFSVLGGALLTRYLLPMYPLVILLAVSTLQRRAPAWQALTAFSAVAFVLGLFINPPYGFAPEDNLAYSHVVRLHEAGIAQLNKLYPGSTVLSAWPVTDELSKPELGYLKKPYDVVPLEDFSAAQISRAAEEPEKYSVALVFSTKEEPSSPFFTLGAKSKEMDERYFGLHQDLQPEAIAQQLGGTLVWKQSDQGQWIALIRFNRAIEARIEGGEVN